VVRAGAPEGLVFPGDPGIPDTLAPTRHRNFAPRAGVAYSPDAKTSVGASFGLFYTAIEGLSAGIMSANPPYGYDYDSLAPSLFATPFVTAASGQDVGQRFPEPIPASGTSVSKPNSTVDWSQYLPITGVPAFFHQNVTPYTESYTLSIERALTGRASIRAGYVGSQAHPLLVLISANPGNAAECLAVSRPEDLVPGTATCGPFGESGTYITRSGQTINGTRAFRRELRGRHYSEDNRQFKLQRLRTVVPPLQPVGWNSPLATVMRSLSISRPASPKRSTHSTRD
jgi:hypothetical protein